MKKADAERLIIAELEKMLPEIPYGGSDGGMLFYNKLAQDRPDLLAFSASGDKWQIVHGWMLKHRLVTS